MVFTNKGMDWESNQLKTDLEAVAQAVKQLADEHQEDSLALLALLRLLENLHRDIRDNLFQASLPNNRQALYALLKDIEANGGWPYIYRMRLQSLLSNLSPDMVATFLPEIQEPPALEEVNRESEP